jgi:hypothetical protein
MAGDVSPDDAELGAAIIRLFRDDLYASVKPLPLRYEVHTHRRYLPSATDLRDALDHIAQACHPQASAEERCASLVSAREHIRRSGVEPLQALVEARMVRLWSQLKGYWWKQHLFPGLPSPHEVLTILNAAEADLVEARLLKGEPREALRVIGLLDGADRALTDLALKTRPRGPSASLRLLLISSVLLLALVAGFVVGLWLAGVH